jgi:hypothetical protein
MKFGIVDNVIEEHKHTRSNFVWIDSDQEPAPGGAFRQVCRFLDGVILEIFTREVFSLLLWKKLIGLPLVEKILSWRHTGFSVHSQIMIRYYGLYSNAHRGKRNGDNI